MRKPLIILFLFTCVALPTKAAGPVPDFSKDIQPVLETNCIKCHGADKQKGDLQLHTRAAMVAGGEAGTAINIEEPHNSLLLQRALLPDDHDEIMPPKGERLTVSQTDQLRSWIAAGAPWPENLELTARKPIKKLVATSAEDAQGLESIAIYPPAIKLTTAEDSQALVAIATYADGTTRDITPKIAFTPKDTSLAKVAANYFTPQKDGTTTVTVNFHGKTAEIPLTVTQAAAPRPISFNLDVMPVFLRSGCNTGSCHGAARGQDGFRLSLFGYDPAGDLHRLTREMGTRRVNLAIPEESLMMEKAVEAVPHAGGKRFERGSQYDKVLMEWLKAGAPGDPKEIARAVSLEIYPKNAVLEGAGRSLQITALAKYSDGTDRDVTSLAVFGSNNSPTAAVTADGLVTAASRGEAFITARFDTFTVGSQIIVIPAGLNYERPKLPEQNYIDTLVHEKLHKLRITPSAVCTDEAFIRRATIDITGMLPTEKAFTAFISDTDPDKRTKLIDELLSRKAFTELWVMKWAELLQIRTDPNNQVSYKSTLLYYNWLQEKIANNVPFNLIVQELLSSTGGTFKVPATNYYQIEKENLKTAENVAQVFMGMRLQCAQCHNHPFDRWTMNDYYGFAAFFRQIGRKRAEDPREMVIFNSGNGELQHPVDKRNMAPKFLGAATPEIKKGTDRREVLAKWLASNENPYFSRNLANIIWAHFLGVGIIDPVDDVRISNPASNPELLDALAKKLTEYDYDFKRLVRDICLSRTYHVDTKTNESNKSDTLNFAHATIRRMRAEVMLDALSQVTDTQNKFQGLPLGARAVQIADGNTSNYFLKTFGRAERLSVCSCEVKVEPNLGQALHLLNGDATGKRLTQGNVVGKMIEAKKPADQIIDSLYIKTLSRKPTETEKNRLLSQVNTETEPLKQKEILEDIFWALMNSKEFMFNH
ncbi:MAG: DUF1549 domain-containing protein [Akkermansiaceae bacterium]